MGHRIYRTDDGRHVLENDPDAAFLAYSQFDEPPKAVLDELEPKADAAKKPAAKKQAAKPADKQAAKGDDK